MHEAIDQVKQLIESRGFRWDDVVLVAEAGSTMHGVGVSDQDDLDLAVVRVETWAELITGPQNDQSVMIRTQPEGQRSGPGDIDIQAYSLRKFTALATAGNPTLLNSLFVHSYLKLDERFQVDRLRQLVDMRKAGAAYLGYMGQQLQRWQNNSGRRVSRPELVDAYGFDTKYAYHAIRLGLQGIEFLTTGQITLPIPEPHRSELASLRTGGLSEKDALDWAHEVEGSLQSCAEAARPATDNARGFVTDFYSQWFGVAASPPETFA
ncbi:MAG: nucleotidyltransferase [bacterium]|nr:nucleotidyltransferase [bacterium]